MTAQTLPDSTKIRGVNFKLDPLQGFNGVRGGNHQTVELGAPLWSAEIDTTTLTRAQAAAYRALKLRARSALGSVYLYDSSMQRPAAYESHADDAEWYCGQTDVYCSQADIHVGGGIRPWGAPIAVEFDRTNSAVKLVNLTPGAIISQHDYGALDDGPARRLFAATEAVTADDDGVAWVKVEPPPPDDDSNLPAEYQMERASAEMVIVAFDMPFQFGEQWRLSASFVQVLRRS